MYKKVSSNEAAKISKETMQLEAVHFKSRRKMNKKLWRECHGSVVCVLALKLFLLHVNSAVISKQRASCESGATQTGLQYQEFMVMPKLNGLFYLCN